MKHFYKYEEKAGYNEIIPDDAGLDLIKFSLIKLEKGENIVLNSGEYEIGLIIFSGQCTVECEGYCFKSLGSRNNVFDGKATTVDIPKDLEYKISSIGDMTLEIGASLVKADKKMKPFVVKPEEVISLPRGQGSWKREVVDILTHNVEGKVDRIILGEVYNKPGCWSSYPPHKHDRDDRPYEVNMEEIYHYKVNPPQGFGIQVMYNDELFLNETYTIRNGDTIAIKEGYHPVASAPGYQVYYLWVMAGNNGRNLAPYDDPKHVWVKAVEAMIK